MDLYDQHRSLSYKTCSVLLLLSLTTTTKITDNSIPYHIPPEEWKKNAHQKSHISQKNKNKKKKKKTQSKQQIPKNNEVGRKQVSAATPPNDDDDNDGGGGDDCQSPLLKIWIENEQPRGNNKMK